MLRRIRSAFIVLTKIENCKRKVKNYIYSINIIYKRVNWNTNLKQKMKATATKVRVLKLKLALCQKLKAFKPVKNGGGEGIKGLVGVEVFGKSFDQVTQAGNKKTP